MEDQGKFKDHNENDFSEALEIEKRPEESTEQKGEMEFHYST